MIETDKKPKNQNFHIDRHGWFNQKKIVPELKNVVLDEFLCQLWLISLSIVDQLCSSSTIDPFFFFSWKILSHCAMELNKSIYINKLMRSKFALKVDCNFHARTSQMSINIWQRFIIRIHWWQVGSIYMKKV